MKTIIPINEDLRQQVVDLTAARWGSSIIATKGKTHNVADLDGFAVMTDGKITGYITYAIIDHECEIVSLDSLVENQGIGTALIEKVIETCRENKCTRIWLLTTNDNTNTIRFYQKRGFNMSGLNINAIREERKIKPEIPLIGFDGIPILHEIEFEMYLTD